MIMIIIITDYLTSSSVGSTKSWRKRCSSRFKCLSQHISNKCRPLCD